MSGSPEFLSTPPNTVPPTRHAHPKDLCQPIRLHKLSAITQACVVIIIQNLQPKFLPGTVLFSNGGRIIKYCGSPTPHPQLFPSLSDLFLSFLPSYPLSPLCSCVHYVQTCLIYALSGVWPQAEVSDLLPGTLELLEAKLAIQSLYFFFFFCSTRRHGDKNGESSSQVIWMSLM